ncbi:SAPS-domain-containing protein [Morchella conica CCBAS932]|uniref:SAPS-domain-containing protein n=1 Tax=Morchella conica CCBAS932 TaxID=1392247 RepID=A0A3N4LH62_9PEZI|nr:SAPS-domain-containing protein [Morchella conica CCBAS932]
MFWRFGGYASISTLDSILDKPDVTLEELLDESDLIQELKQHNTKLIEYLRDEAVLRRLLEYVIAPRRTEESSSSDGWESSVSSKEGEEGIQNGWAQLSETEQKAEREREEKSRLKYAYVSCEVLSSETWSLAESLMGNLSHLRMFWEFLERPSPLDPLQAGYFTKVNETLLDKKTEEMMEFFKGLPNIVSKILKHVECPMIMDLLLKIISMEKCEGGAGIVEWLHSQNLMPQLLKFLSPEYSAVAQTSSGDFIKAIITISANASQNEQSCIGPNDLTRQLVSEACVKGLIRDMLCGGNPLTVGVGIVIEVIRKNNSDYDPEVGGIDNTPSSRDPIYLGTLLRLFATHVPDFMNLILTQTMVVTNDDGTKTEKKRELKAAYGGTIEPLGFDRFKTCELMAELLHCSNMALLNEQGAERYVRERDRERDRIWAERERDRLEAEGLADINGVVEGVVVEKAPLQVQNGGVEDTINEEDFEDVAVSLDETGKESAQTSIGQDPFSDPEKDSKPQKASEDEDLFVDEPLSPPTTPADTTITSTSDNSKPIPAAILADEIPRLDVTPPTTVLAVGSPAPFGTTEKPKELEKKLKGVDSPLPPLPENGKDSIEKGQTGIERNEGGLLNTEVPKAPSPPPVEEDDDSLLKGGRSLVADMKAASEALDQQNQPQYPEEDLMDLGGSSDTTVSDEGNATFRSLGNSSFEEYEPMIEKDSDGNPVVGDFLKMMFVENSVVPTILDFFFRFPWNNFLHNVVYDVVQQVFNGPMDRGYNRALAIDLFVTGRITERIVDGQKESDRVQAERNMRLGYMGHLTLIAEEVVKFAERHPPEILGHKVLEKVSDSIWVEYVEDTLAATRERDNAILGGVRPDMNVGPRQAVLNAVQAQAFNANATNAGSLTLSGSIAAELDSIDLQNGSNNNSNNTSTVVGSGTGSGSAGGLLSGFGSSSDEEDEDLEHDEDDEEVTRLGLSGSSDQVGDLTDFLFDDDLEDIFEDMTFL